MNIKAHIHMLLEVRAAHPTPSLYLQMHLGWRPEEEREPETGRSGQAWGVAWTQSLFNLSCLFQGLRELQGLQNFPEDPHH